MAGLAVLLLAGVWASKVSGRLGIPAVLVFLAIGMLAGSEGVGGIEFADYDAARALGIVALSFILFSGGFDTNPSDVRAVARYAVLLALAGVALTALFVGVVARWVLGLPFATSFLLGSIVSSTDAAAVFSVLRSRRVGLGRRVRATLELESGSNDPMAVFLTLASLRVATGEEAGAGPLIGTFTVQMAVGAAVGLVCGRASAFLINRMRLEYEGLYPVLLTAGVLLAYGLAATLGGSGFLAVYVAGIVLSGAELIHKRSLLRFADGVAWLMQIAMFLALGLLVFPSDLGPVAPEALLLAGVLMFVARPLACLLLLVPARFGWRESAFVAWVGLRGAAPIVLATFPFAEGHPQAELLFNVVFFIVLTSVLVQGTTVARMARWFGVARPERPRRVAPLELVEPAGGRRLHELVVHHGSTAVGCRVVDLQLPEGVLIVLVTRGDTHLVPQGSTTLEAGDLLVVLADDAALERARPSIEGVAP
jgi:cell volume regulation protein A